MPITVLGLGDSTVTEAEQGTDRLVEDSQTKLLTLVSCLPNATGSFHRETSLPGSTVGLRLIGRPCGGWPGVDDIGQQKPGTAG